MKSLILYVITIYDVFGSSFPSVSLTPKIRDPAYNVIPGMFRARIKRGVKAAVCCTTTNNNNDRAVWWRGGYA